MSDPCYRYLEVGSGYDSTIKPWVWVLLVALGPIVTSLTEQRRHVIGVRNIRPLYFSNIQLIQHSRHG